MSVVSDRVNELAQKYHEAAFRARDARDSFLDAIQRHHSAHVRLVDAELALVNAIREERGIDIRKTNGVDFVQITVKV